MLKYFLPDIIYDNVHVIDYETFIKQNKKGIIFDIDNTLVSYKQEIPTPKVDCLIKKLSELGFIICFISNNKKKRVELFNEKYKFKTYPEAGKPSLKVIKKALSELKLKKEEVVFIGDQIFTDVFAAKKAGFFSVLVKPIEPVENIFFKLKRVGEKPFLYHYQKKYRSKKQKEFPNAVDKK